MMPNTPRASPERGFTLIEIIAVIAITGFVMYAVYSVLVSTLVAQQSIDDAVDVYAVGPEIVELIVQDLQSATMGLVEDNQGLKGGMENVGGTEVSYIDVVTTQDSRTVILKSDVEYHSDVTEIGYHLRPSEVYPEYLELFRREDWGVDDQPLAGSLFHKVYDRVKEFKLEYIEAGKEEDETWAEAWDTETKKTLPRAIHLYMVIVAGDPDILATMDEGAGEVVFDRIIVLPGGDDVPEPQQDPDGPGGPGQPGR
jgi:prepilin-type N-terminal cleavage/methylation domain-containing protein